MRLWYQDQLCGMGTHAHTKIHAQTRARAPWPWRVVGRKTKRECDTEETPGRRNMLWFLSASWAGLENQRRYRHRGNDRVETRQAETEWRRGLRKYGKELKSAHTHTHTHTQTLDMCMSAHTKIHCVHLCAALVLLKPTVCMSISEPRSCLRTYGIVRTDTHKGSHTHPLKIYMW